MADTAVRQSTGLTLAQVMEDHPELTDFGIGVFNDRHETAEQRRVEHAEARERLAQSQADVDFTVAWLRANIRPVKRPHPRASSYGMKHVMERARGLRRSRTGTCAKPCSLLYRARY